MEAILSISRLGFKGITYDNDALNEDEAKVKGKLLLRRC